MDIDKVHQRYSVSHNYMLLFFYKTYQNNHYAINNLLPSCKLLSLIIYIAPFRSLWVNRECIIRFQRICLMSFGRVPVLYVLSFMNICKTPLAASYSEALSASKVREKEGVVRSLRSWLRLSKFALKCFTLFSDQKLSVESVYFRAGHLTLFGEVSF